MDLTRAARNDTKPFHPLTSLECLDQIEEVLLHGWALRAKRTRTHHGMQVDAKAAMRTTGDILVHLVVGFPSASRSVGERKRHGNSSRRCKILASAQEKNSSQNHQILCEVRAFVGSRALQGQECVGSIEMRCLPTPVMSDCDRLSSNSGCG